MAILVSTADASHPLSLSLWKRASVRVQRA
jgi:hypothetical protein